MNRRTALLLCRGGIGLLLAVLLPPCGSALAASTDGCARCHTDTALIDELTEDLITQRQEAASSELQVGEGYAVKKAPFDLYENVLVRADFLQSAHGKIPCAQCHQGDPSADTPEAAHRGLVRDPTLTGAAEACGGCHKEIASTGAPVPHASVDSSLAALQVRCASEQWRTLNSGAIRQQCASCHEASCGGCHVSRPRINGGGLVAGHNFQRRPDFVYQCAACHAQPVADDFTGKMSRGDIHYLKGKVCVDCHGAKEAHAGSAGQSGSRHLLAARARCIDCHADLAKSAACANERHKGKVDCAVCHAQAYENCTSCHMGEDEEGLAYSQSGGKYKSFKIGRNTAAGQTGQPDFVLVRQIPVKADSFAAYLKEPLANFQQGETFKRSQVHNIQRRTWQNAHCNHCHGKKALFLTEADVPEAERAANRGVLVAASDIPAAVSGQPPLTVPGPKTNDSLKVDAAWLKEHLADPGVIVLDVRLRKQYEEGHIPGARHLCECYFMHDYKSKTPFLLKTPAELAALLSREIGLSPEARVIIYDDGKNKTGLSLLALERIGHQRVSFLDGALEGWVAAGQPLEKGAPPVVPDSGYVPKPREVLISSREIKEAKEGSLLVLDARQAAEHMGHARRTDVAKRAGRLPGSASLPVRGLFDQGGRLKSADELNWTLAQYGITPGLDKTIVTTCNTKTLAAELYLVLRYLGYDNVKVHDGSWAEWSKLY